MAARDIATGKVRIVFRFENDRITHRSTRGSGCSTSGVNVDGAKLDYQVITKQLFLRKSYPGCVMCFVTIVIGLWVLPLHHCLAQHVAPVSSSSVAAATFKSSPQSRQQEESQPFSSTHGSTGVSAREPTRQGEKLDAGFTGAALASKLNPKVTATELPQGQLAGSKVPTASFLHGDVTSGVGQQLFCSSIQEKPCQALAGAENVEKERTKGICGKDGTGVVGDNSVESDLDANKVARNGDAYCRPLTTAPNKRSPCATDCCMQRLPIRSPLSSIAFRIGAHGKGPAAETTGRAATRLLQREDIKTRGEAPLQQHFPAAPELEWLAEQQVLDPLCETQQTQHVRCILKLQAKEKQGQVLSCGKDTVYFPCPHSRLVTITVDEHSNKNARVNILPWETESHFSRQKQHLRSLAAEVADKSLRSLQRDVESDAQHLTGNGEAGEAEKETLGVLAGAGGRNGGIRQRRRAGASPPFVPGGYPSYYGALTPQQLQLLAGNLPQFPGLQYTAPPQLLSFGQQNGSPEQRTFSQAQLSQAYLQQQQQRGDIVDPPPFQDALNYQPLSASIGGSPSGGRRFSRENISPRRRQRTRRHQLQYLLEQQQQQQLPVAYLMNGSASAPTYWTYSRESPLRSPATPRSFPSEPNNRYARALDFYPDFSEFDSGYSKAPRDPNLLPLQRQQQSAQGMLYEAQLRRQHDAWRARDGSTRV